MPAHQWVPPAVSSPEGPGPPRWAVAETLGEGPPPREAAGGGAAWGLDSGPQDSGAGTSLVSHRLTARDRSHFP